MLDFSSRPTAAASSPAGTCIGGQLLYLTSVPGLLSRRHRPQVHVLGVSYCTWLQFQAYCRDVIARRYMYWGSVTVLGFSSRPTVAASSPAGTCIGGQLLYLASVPGLLSRCHRPQVHVLRVSYCTWLQFQAYCRGFIARRYMYWGSVTVSGFSFCLCHIPIGHDLAPPPSVLALYVCRPRTACSEVITTVK